MRTPRCDAVRIGPHFHKNAYMHKQTTIGIHKEDVPKLVYTLFCCKPVEEAIPILSTTFMVSIRRYNALWGNNFSPAQTLVK